MKTEKIGLWSLTSLVTGNLVGSGVYMLPATLAAFGTLSLVGWGITSLGALFLALVFAGLSSHTQASGGPYQFARMAFGDTVGYFVCWSYWMLSWISNPALAVAAVGALSSLYGPFTPLETFLWEFGIVLGLSTFNLMGIKVTGLFEFWITIIKVIPLIILPLMGFFMCETNYFPTFHMADLSNTQAISAAAALSMWAFIGLETGTVPAGNVIKPEKTISRATILGTLIAAIIYILGTVVIFRVVPLQDLLTSNAPYADAAHYIFGGNWSMPVAVAIIITCLGTLNGWIMVVARIPYGAAKDGLFPSLFKQVNRHGTPYWGVIIAGVCAIPLLLMTFETGLLQQFKTLVDVAVTQILLVYLVCIGAYFVLLKRRASLNTRVMVIGTMAGLYTLWALFSISLDMILYSLVILAAGLPMWLQRHKKI